MLKVGGGVKMVCSLSKKEHTRTLMARMETIQNIAIASMTSRKLAINI